MNEKNVTIVLDAKTGDCLRHGVHEEVIEWLNTTSRRNFVVATGDDCIDAQEIYLKSIKK